MVDTSIFYTFTEKLIDLGYSDIEVGHGLGLGAWRKYSSGCTDEELWTALAPLTDKARLYSFFIPYLGVWQDIELAIERGVHGIRVGMEPDYVKDYLPLLEKIKKSGVKVFLNLMKSYTVSAEAFTDIVAMAKDIIDVVYIVDSSGHMLPGEVKQYVDAIYSKFGMIPLGFHGHNNLGLAVATSLELIDMGVEYIDTTLTGIGRSGGNVPTETMVGIISKKYGSPFYNDELFLNTLKLADEFRTYVYSKGKEHILKIIYILYGYAGFHSSFEDLVGRYTERHALEYNETILKICKEEKIRLTDSVLAKLLK
jgi:hypothetical protein